MDEIYSVSQINNYIKNMFLRDGILNHIYMKGEVSNCKYHTSGHIYFTIKDGTGQMACVMFAGQRAGLPFQLQEGQSIIVLGSISVYERDGKYQMYAKEIKRDGLGLLYERFEQLKIQLSEEGLFDVTLKKSIPSFPKKIGIVTASTGAAIQDICSISLRRNPYVQLILYPALVQGEGAARSIVKGLRVLDQLGVDTIIIGRGGGSIEDLWAFNEEIVARAIFACKTPVISAVGHETDTTIADFVSDLRAPTPSAAAELAVNNLNIILSAMVDYHTALSQTMLRKINNARNQAGQIKMKLGYSNPVHQLRQKRQAVADAQEKIELLMQQAVLRKKHQMEIYIEKMKGLSPLLKLQRGYSYIQDEKGKTVNQIAKAEPGKEITIAVTDGQILATVTKTISEDWAFIKK